MMSERAPFLAERLQGFGTTIFAEMSALAVRTGSVNLGQGFPDTDGPAELLAAAVPATPPRRSPHTPPGTVFARGELGQVAALARDRELLVVTGEVYEHVVFDGEHVPIATLPGMRERTVTISSAGKTSSATGWKIGWVCAPPALVSAVTTAKQFLTYVSGAPVQPAVPVATALPDGAYTRLRDRLRDCRDLLVGGLREVGYDVLMPAGTYFA